MPNSSDIDLLRFLVADGVLNELSPTEYVGARDTRSASGNRRTLTATVQRLPTGAINQVDFTVSAPVLAGKGKKRSPRRGAVRS